MPEFIWKCLNWRPNRDNNYYFGLFLLIIGILTIVIYLIFDLFEPLSFLITFLICGWGFVLLWKSDHDLCFTKAQEKITALEAEIAFLRRLI